jgi:hypothetical protein
MDDTVREVPSSSGGETGPAAAARSATTGRCSRPPRISTIRLSTAPGRPRTSACGFALGDCRGQGSGGCLQRAIDSGRNVVASLSLALHFGFEMRYAWGAGTTVSTDRDLRL